jgi:hypothetical protein
MSYRWLQKSKCRIFNRRNMMGDFSGTGTAYLSEAPVFLTFVVGYCIVRPSSIDLRLIITSPVSPKFPRQYLRLIITSSVSPKFPRQLKCLIDVVTYISIRNKYCNNFCWTRNNVICVMMKILSHHKCNNTILKYYDPTNIKSC